LQSTEALYDSYLVAASTSDPDQRTHLLRQCAIEDLEMISPQPYALRGIPAISRQLGLVAAGNPSGRLRLRRTSRIDHHNNLLRCNFANFDDVNRVTATGMHVIELADHRIVRILVFVPEQLEPISGS
jgi:hypothetical protein